MDVGGDEVEGVAGGHLLGFGEDSAAVAVAHAGVDDEGGAVADDDADVGDAGGGVGVGDDVDVGRDLLGVAGADEGTGLGLAGECDEGCREEDCYRCGGFHGG
jgi:hypothetical protein